VNEHVIRQVAEHLAAIGYRFRIEDGIIRAGFVGEAIAYELVIAARRPLIHVVTPRVARVPAARVDEVIRLANLVNARLLLGHFSVDDERDLRHEVTVLAPGGPSLEQVGIALEARVAIDGFSPAFMRVIWGGLRAAAALAELDGADGAIPPGGEEAEDDGPAMDLPA
jgi:hypothetical protein